MTFWSTYKACLVRPRETAEALAADKRGLRLGFAAFLVPVLGYIIVYIGLGHSGAYPSKFTPWLEIPAEEYYRWNLFLLPPSMFAGWLLASAVVQIASRPLGGTLRTRPFRHRPIGRATRHHTAARYVACISRRRLHANAAAWSSLWDGWLSASWSCMASST